MVTVEIVDGTLVVNINGGDDVDDDADGLYEDGNLHRIFSREYRLNFKYFARKKTTPIFLAHNLTSRGNIFASAIIQFPVIYNT